MGIDHLTPLVIWIQVRSGAVLVVVEVKEGPGPGLQEPGYVLPDKREGQSGCQALTWTAKCQEAQRVWRRNAWQRNSEVEAQKPSAGNGTRRLRNTDVGLWAVGHMDLGHCDPDRPDLCNDKLIPVWLLGETPWHPL